MNHGELSEKNEFENKPMDKEHKTKKCFYGKWLFIFALVLSLLAIGASLSIEKLLWDKMADLTTNHTIIENSLKKVQQQLPELQSEIKNQQESINEWLNQIKATKRNWVYREAAYLTKQGAYQLKLANIDGAMGLFNDALNTLNTLSVPQADEIKSHLVGVIRVLKSTKVVDRDNIISQLDQLKTQVEKLPLNLPQIANAKVANSAQNTASGILKPLQESWEQVKQLIVIRHHERPIEPLITPLEHVYLKQNLTLQLEQTNMAVLYRDNDLYHSSLQKITTWVKQFFDPHAAATKEFLTAIDTLLQIDITPASPDVFADLHAILKQLEAKDVV